MKDDSNDETKPEEKEEVVAIAKDDEAEEVASNQGDQQPSVSDDSQANETKNVGRKRTIDESLLDADELRKLESRRAYNRQCAAKARKRSKELVSHLQGQVEELSRDKSELKRSNEVMRAQLDLLEGQNRNLMMNQLAAGGQGGGGMGVHGGYGGYMGMGGGFGGGGMGGGVSLLDRLAMERAATQNQMLMHQQGMGSSGGMGVSLGDGAGHGSPSKHGY